MTKKRDRPDFGPDEFEVEYQLALDRMAALAGAMVAEGIDRRLVAGAMLQIACQGLSAVLTDQDVSIWLRRLAGMLDGDKGTVDAADFPPIQGTA